MHPLPQPPEAGLLREALALGTSTGIALVSREPFGDGSVAGFEVTGSPGAATTLTYFVDTSRRPVDRETGLAAGPPDAPDARVWLHPADPHLPALAPVAFDDAATTLLGRLGMTPTDPPAIAAYRPGRRAVVRVATTSGTAWIKVVPPARVERIVRTHRVLADHGVPVPTVRGWSDEGLLVSESARGTPATDVPWEPDALLDEVDRLRALFEAVPFAHAARVGLDRRLEWYAARLAGVLEPAQAARADAVVERIRSQWGTPHADRTVHGDLHFGQLFLDGGRITGVIDVDTTGRGIPSDDTAAFLSHAIASATLTAAPQRERVWLLARAALTRWDAASDDGLRSRAATHLLGHALGAWEAGDQTRAAQLIAAAASVTDADAAALDDA